MYNVCIYALQLRVSQSVFLIVISFLYEVLKDLPEDDWEKKILAYDNMCHLDALKGYQPQVEHVQLHKRGHSVVLKEFVYITVSHK